MLVLWHKGTLNLSLFATNMSVINCKLMNIGSVIVTSKAHCGNITGWQYDSTLDTIIDIDEHTFEIVK